MLMSFLLVDQERKKNKMKIPLPDIEIINSKFCGDDCPYLDRIYQNCLLFKNNLKFDDKDMSYVRCHFCIRAIDTNN